MSPIIVQALDTIKRGQKKELLLFSKTLTDEDLEPLVGALIGSKIETLDLDNNRVQNISGLVKALPLSNITTLHLYGNRIKNLTALVQCLPNTKLQVLSIGGNQLTSFDELVQVLPKTKLSTLSLFSTAGLSNIQGLIRAVKVSLHIQDVDVDYCSVSKADKLTLKLALQFPLWKTLLILRSTQHVKRISKRAAVRYLPRDLCRELASFLL